MGTLSGRIIDSVFILFDAQMEEVKDKDKVQRTDFHAGEFQD